MTVSARRDRSSASGPRPGLRTRTLIVSLALVATISPASRGELPPQPKEEAPLVVEGAVREVFRSVRRTRIDYLVAIEVRSARLRPPVEEEEPGGEVREPKVGEVVYVRAFRRRADAPALPGPVGYRAIPAEGTVIRAYLYPSNQGGLQFAYPEGFDRLGSAEPGPLDAEPSTGDNPLPPSIDPDAGSRRRIGVFVAQVRVGNRRGLQVNAVVPESPAARAGLEPGDIILEADGVETQDVAGLNRLVSAAGEKVRLTIRDVRTGQRQEIEVPLGESE